MLAKPHLELFPFFVPGWKELGWLAPLARLGVLLPGASGCLTSRAALWERLRDEPHRTRGGDQSKQSGSQDEDAVLASALLRERVYGDFALCCPGPSRSALPFPPFLSPVRLITLLYFTPLPACELSKHTRQWSLRTP